MQKVIGMVLFLFAASGPSDPEPLDELFDGWARAQGKVESLIVEFDLETKDNTFNTVEKFTGRFSLIRNKRGEVFALYDTTRKESRDGKAKHSAGLLNGGKVYLLNHDEKKATSVEITDSELMAFLEDYFICYTVLLDRKRAEEKWHLEIVKQDNWYSYLKMTPKQATWSLFGWFQVPRPEGRAVLMRKDSDTIPKGMPRQLWVTDGSSEHKFEIKSWRLNPTQGPNLEDFTRPEDKPGWKVGKMPFQGKKESEPTIGNSHETPFRVTCLSKRHPARVIRRKGLNRAKCTF